jgi:hypothetical protein
LDGWKVKDGFSEAVRNKDIIKMRAILNEERSETCRELVEEVHHFEKWCKDHQLRVNRPNSMNKYGAILDDFGLQPVLDEFMKAYIQPFSTFLYPVLGQDLDSHHGFVVEYELGKDTNLGFHVDDSEVTLNVCLGDVFTGGHLFFKGVRCDKHVHTAPAAGECFDLEHKVGMGVFHVGRHRHGANDLTSGHRINLIMWCRSSHQRQARSCGNCSCHSPCPEWCGLYSGPQHSQ